jgi:hypothetical protein
MAELKFAGAVLLSVALAMGWVLALLRTPAAGLIGKVIRSPRQLLRCHIDYLMMALFLFAFAALVEWPPMWLVWTAIVGAAVNPFMFFLTALVPEWDQKPPKWYEGLAIASFLATTVGFAGLAWGIALG